MAQCTYSHRAIQHCFFQCTLPILTRLTYRASYICLHFGPFSSKSFISMCLSNFLQFTASKLFLKCSECRKHGSSITKIAATILFLFRVMPWNLLYLTQEAVQILAHQLKWNVVSPMVWHFLSTALRFVG